MGTTNEYLWVIPLVICVTMLIIFSQLALMCAVVFREQRFKHQPLPVPPKVEDCYAWTVLPLQTIVSSVTHYVCYPNISALSLSNINVLWLFR